MDFYTTKNFLNFTVDGAQFDTKSAIAAGVVFELQDMLTALSNKDRKARNSAYHELKKMYQRILNSESYARFEPLIDGRCDDDDTPIDALLLVEITKWIIGEGLGKGRTAKQPS